MVDVVGSDEFEDWYKDLDGIQKKAVAKRIFLLRSIGVALGFPYSSEIKGSKFPLRELRVKAKGRQIRVFYAFAPSREGVLLLGGDKTGDDRFYQKKIPQAERIWVCYLKEKT